MWRRDRVREAGDDSAEMLARSGMRPGPELVIYSSSNDVATPDRMAPQMTTIQIKLPRKPFPATVETSHTCPVAVAPGRQWPWLGVAGVAVVNIISELVDLYTTLNVFHCYTLLHSHSGTPWPWPARSGCAHDGADTHLLGLTAGPNP